MQPSIRDNYLETEVMTATPQKLQYMLIDAAIRNLSRAKHLRGEGRGEQACEALIRAQQIVTQILAGLNRDVNPDLARKVAAIYMFVFRTINDAQVAADDSKIDECLSVLEIERETWRLLCENLEKDRPAENLAARTTFSGDLPSARNRPAAPAPTMPFLDLTSGHDRDELLSSGFSIEA
ncbi:MAG: flagellar export chaperone FliS [Thermoguttaceae bacterium]